MAYHHSQEMFEKLGIVPTTVALLSPTAPDGSVATVTDDPENPIYVRQGGVWAPSSSATNLTTFEALTFPVDYNDVTAVDPPANMVFTRQAEITAFLAGSGTSNFKHLQAAWNSTPVIVRHDLTFNLAAGVHRPRNPESNSYAFNFVGRLIISGVKVYVQGSQGSNYRVDVASTAISSVNNVPGDPYVEFVGTPFTGLDLRGYFVVFDTAQVAVIHKNTDSRLYLCSDASPAPTSAFVGRPSTVLRNSYSDTSAAKSSGSVQVNPCDAYGTASFVYLYDVAIESFNSYWDLYVFKMACRTARVLIDHAGVIDDFGVTLSNIRPVQTIHLLSRLYFEYSSIRGCGMAATPGGSYTGVMYFGYTENSALRQSYVGSISGISLTSGANVFSNRTVVDSPLSYGFQLEGNNCSLWNQDRASTYNGKAMVIRNCPGTGISIARGGIFGSNAWNRWMFDGVVGPCISFIDNSKMIEDYYTDGVFANEGVPCSNVGIEFVGMQSLAHLFAAATVTGALGDVRMSDGEIWSYADILAAGPIRDELGNVVRKDT
jgi:hypothetical protein